MDSIRFCKVYLFLAFLFLVSTFAAAQRDSEVRTLKAGDGKSWYKGNTHTHTLWSDGDAAPEIAVLWYRDHGYDFLCLSDHNILSTRDKDVWMRIGSDRLSEERVKEIKDVFGDDWIETKTSDGARFMRLKTLPELRERFERPGEFLLIQAEEITSRRLPVHINGLNLREFVSPDHDGTPPEIMNYFLGAVDEQSERLGVPMIAHINHPNWSGGIVAEDLMQVGPGRYFEVYNGHGGVRNWGNKRRAMPNTDRLWDIVLSMRLKDGPERPMYGFGTDDTHNYFENRVGLANAGRGWTWILAEELSAEALIEACKRGDFYASSGVTLNEITIEENRIEIVIAAQDEIRYRVQFIGTRRGFDASSKPALDADGQPLDHATRVYSEEVGQTLHETTENPAVYEFKGDELYVRVKIISDKLQTNPFAVGDFEMAWTQPVLIR